MEKVLRFSAKGIPIIFVDDTLFALQQLAQFYRREINVKVIGITGSNGKTTVKDIIEGILRSTYRVHKTKVILIVKSVYR